MNHKRWLPQMIGLTLVVLLLVACGAPQPAAVQRVKAFHKAINAIEPSEGTGGMIIQIEGKEFTALVDIFREHTTQSAGLPGLSPLILAMASGMVRFSNMEYEVVSEVAECAVVKATGDITIGEETKTSDEEYVVVKRGGKWLINFDAKSCY